MDWRALEVAVDQTIGAAFGERVGLLFLSKALQDPARPAIETSGILHVGGDDSKPISAGDQFRTRLALGSAELFLDRSTYVGPIPRKGDKVRALDRAGRPWFEVSTVSDRYSNLIVLTLGEA